MTSGESVGAVHLASTSGVAVPTTSAKRVRAGAGGAVAPLLGPRRAKAHLLRDPEGKALAVRVIVAPNELVEVRIIEGQLVEGVCEHACRE